MDAANTRPRRRIRRTVGPFVITIALILSGCVEVNIESEFNSDGSARHVVESTIEKDALQQLQAMGGGEIDMFAQMDEAQQQAEAAGLKFEKIDIEDKAGFRVSKTVEDSRDIGATFDEIFSATAGDDAEARANAFSGTFDTSGDEYRLDMTIDSNKLFAGAGEQAAGQIPPGQMESIITSTYTATMPGTIKETNGEKIDDNTVVWALPLSGTTEIMAVSETESSSVTPTIIVIGVTLLFIVGAGVVLLLLTGRPIAPRRLFGFRQPRQS